MEAARRGTAGPGALARSTGPETDDGGVPAGIRRGAYLPELESLRGIAIVLVYAFHTDGILGFLFRNRAGTWPPLPIALVWAGHTGVSLFFVLSAFLLSLPFLVEADGGRRVSRRDFYVRRALRILPLFYVAVLVATVATAHGVRDLRHAIPYLTFTFFWPGLATSLQPFNAAWWSLAVEIQFYALLPLIALAFGRSRTTTLLSLAAFAVVWVAILASPLNPPFVYFTVLGRAPLFLCGILAAWAWHRHGAAWRARFARSPWLRRGGADVILVATVAALAAVLRWRLFWQSWVQHHEMPILVPEGVLWAAVVLEVLLLPLAAKALVSNRFLAWLGMLSYSIYLVHFPLLRLTLDACRGWFPGAIPVDWTAASAAWAAVATGLCLGISSLTYRWIETPFLARKARIATDRAG